MIRTWLSRIATLTPAVVYGVFLVTIAAALWFALGAAPESGVWPAFWWYLAVTAVVTGVATTSWWLTDTPHQQVIPRIEILATFLMWLVVQMAPLFVTNVAAGYFIALLEAPLLYTLLALVSLRVISAFAPALAATTLTIVSLGLGLLVCVITPTTLNYALATEANVKLLISGVGYTAIIVAGFGLFFASVCAIPFGRRTYPEHPTTSVGPLIFSEALDAQDVNYIETVSNVVHNERRHALRRGQWLHFRNFIEHGQGIILSNPKSLRNFITTLVEFARHKNQTRAIGIILMEDTQHPYLHCAISYEVNTHKKSDFITFKEHATELGGVLTVDRNERITTLTVSFPLQW